MQKFEAEIWCYKCDGTWKTDDHFAVKECPLCGSGEFLYEVGSIPYFFAYHSRHPEEKKKLDESIAAEKAKLEALNH